MRGRIINFDVELEIFRGMFRARKHELRSRSSFFSFSLFFLFSFFFNFPENEIFHSNKTVCLCARARAHPSVRPSVEFELDPKEETFFFRFCLIISGVRR